MVNFNALLNVLICSTHSLVTLCKLIMDTEREIKMKVEVVSFTEMWIIRMTKLSCMQINLFADENSHFNRLEEIHATDLKAILHNLSAFAYLFCIKRDYRKLGKSGKLFFKVVVNIICVTCLFTYFPKKRKEQLLFICNL